MKSFPNITQLVIAAALLVAAAFTPAYSQSLPNVPTSVEGSLYYSQGYAGWSNSVATGVAAAGTTITVKSGSVILGDSREIVPFSNAGGAFAPITVGLGATQETVTPTSVSGCVKGGLANYLAPPCIITVSGGFTNAHSPGEPIVSGDQGVMEAINDAASNGGGNVFWIVDTGIVTLSTGGLTTTTTTLVPKQRTSTSASARVETTITTSANWAVGSTASGASFCSANSTLTAGTTCLGNQVAPTSTGTTAGLEAVVFTMGTSNPGAGAIKARVWGFTAAQSAQ